MSSIIKFRSKVLGILICFFLMQVNFQIAHAQCTSTISSFPYSEGFETSNGNWNPGGTSSDWAWGTPSKNVITGAATGQKCWITGGLTGNFYNYSQRSYLLSPCFDFTSVPDPFISFSIFWDTENQYDGASFQYSIDGGFTWNYIGSYGAITNCLNGNWFNTNNINNLTTLGSNPKNGWSGNTQATSGSCAGGGGSGQWVTAKQQIGFLGGFASVQFRFTFGAGSQCNNYNGFAVDDIYVGASPIPLAANFNNTPAGCNTANGSSTINVTGGVATYNYAWNGITGNTATVNSLFAGNYSVVVTDDIGCTATFNTTVPSSPPVQFNGTAITDTCGKSKGKINLNVTNGTPPYSYQWSNGAASLPSAQNLAAGAYTVTVTDSKNCTATSTFTVNNITGPSITLSNTPDTCGLHKGTITINASNGAVPYSYQWQGGTTANTTLNLLAAGNYSVTVTDAYGCTAYNSTTISTVSGFSFSQVILPDSCSRGKGKITLTTNGGVNPFQYQWMGSASSSNVAQNLVTGNYTVTVTDNAGCTSSSNFTVANINSLSLSSTTAADTCNKHNGSIHINAINGKAPYTYQWQTGSSTNPTLQNVAAGSYTITVNDNGGCTKATSANVILIPSFSFSGAILPDSCGKNTGKISLTLNGGTLPFQYGWSNGAASLPVAQNLQKGNYTVTVTDIKGCTSSNAYVVPEVPSVIAMATTAPDTCLLSLGAITVNATNGTPPYIYQWSGGSGGNAVIKNLASGSYSITITDNKNCVANTSAIVANVKGFELSFTATSDTCSLAKGSVIFLTQGGVTPFLYQWQNDSSFSSIIDSLVQGSYNFTITDARNCSVQQPVEINNTGNISINLGSKYVICPGSPLELTPGVYKDYIWSDGSSLPVLEINSAGSYWVDVTDEHGCTATDTTLVVEDCLHDILLPKAFSPNDDGMNDYFFPAYTTVTSYSLVIMNRWGQPVFKTDSPVEKWNGNYKSRICPQDIYVWVTDFVIEGESKRKQGTVMLLR